MVAFSGPGDPYGFSWLHPFVLSDKTAIKLVQLNFLVAFLIEGLLAKKFRAQFLRCLSVDGLSAEKFSAQLLNGLNGLSIDGPLLFCSFVLRLNFLAAFLWLGSTCSRPVG